MSEESPVDQSLTLEPQYAAELDLVRRRMQSENWKKLDQIDAGLEKFDPINLPLNHVFTPGLYVRSIFMPKGAWITTRIHLTEHPFIVSAGVVSVWDDENGWVTLRAFHQGITKPGTRRFLYIHEDCIWTTVHANPKDEQDPDKIVMEVTFTGGKFSTLGAAAAMPALAEKGST